MYRKLKCPNCKAVIETDIELKNCPNCKAKLVEEE
jgi:RNA polymerase subunit RPABC4/transcription elongation factor Spt4